jgi:TolB-like protein
MFELTQTADLTGWDGSSTDGIWLAFLADVKRFVGAGAAETAADALQPLQAALSSARLSICVLPFANMSRDDDQEYFADGISEDIITDLSKVSALSVIARNSAFAFKGRHVDVKQVARQLEVSHVLEGSVRKAGNRVRITAQLINGATNDHLWADRWDRDLDDIFALQDEISQAIVGALKLKLLPEEKKSIADRGTNSLEAYDLYLRARAIANSATSAADFRQAIDAFDQVLKVDPDFAAARGDIAGAYVLYTGFAPELRDETLGALEAIVTEAQQRAPDHWASLFANGALLLTRMDWGGAAAAFAKALAAAPSDSAVGLQFSMSLNTMGRSQEALKLLEAARAADPLSAQISFSLQHTLYVLGRREESQREYERTLALPGLREPRDHLAVQRVWDTGDLELTRLQLRRYLANPALPMPALAKLLDLVDQPSAALEMIREAYDDPSNQSSLRMMFIAWYAARFGDDDLALNALRRCYVDLARSYPTAMWRPVLRRVRQAPGFKQLVRDLGIYDSWRASGNWGDFARLVGDDDFEIIR